MSREDAINREKEDAINRINAAIKAQKMPKLGYVTISHSEYERLKGNGINWNKIDDGIPENEMDVVFFDGDLLHFGKFWSDDTGDYFEEFPDNFYSYNEITHWSEINAPVDIKEIEE